MVALDGVYLLEDAQLRIAASRTTRMDRDPREWGKTLHLQMEHLPELGNPKAAVTAVAFKDRCILPTILLSSVLPANLIRLAPWALDYNHFNL